MLLKKITKKSPKLSTQDHMPLLGLQEHASSLTTKLPSARIEPATF